MYQLAARMGTKMMGGLGFHEVLNNVSKPEKQTLLLLFVYIMYYIKYKLLFHSKNGNTKRF